MSQTKRKGFLGFMRKHSKSSEDRDAKSAEDKGTPEPTPTVEAPSPRDTANSTNFSKSATMNNSSTSQASTPGSNTGHSRSASMSAHGGYKVKVSARALFLGQKPQLQRLQGPDSEISHALQEFLSTSPHDWVGHRMHCILLLHLGMETGMDRHFKDAIEHAVIVVMAMPRSPLPHVLKAVAYFMLGQHKPALLACEQALQQDPKDLSAQVLRKLLEAESALRAGSMEEVCKCCMEGLMLLGGSSNRFSWALHEALFSMRTALHRVRSLAMIQLGRFQDSKQDEEIAAFKGASVRSRNALLGEILLLSDGRSRMDEAVEALQRSVQEGGDGMDDRTKALLCLAEGQVAWEDKNAQGAAEKCTEGLVVLQEAGGGKGVAPHFASMKLISSMLLELMAKSCHSIGEFSGVLEAGERLMKEDSKNPLGKFWKAMALVWKQDFEEATTSLDQASAESPNAQWPEFLEHVVAGCVAAKLGTNFKAVKEANQAIATFSEVQDAPLLPKDLALCRRLRCYASYMQEKRENAVADALEALHHDPGNPAMEALASGAQVSHVDLWNNIFGSFSVTPLPAELPQLSRAPSRVREEDLAESATTAPGPGEEASLGISGHGDKKASMSSGSFDFGEQARVAPSNSVGGEGSSHAEKLPGVPQGAKSPKPPRPNTLPHGADYVVQYSEEEIAKATSNFSRGNKLGQGTFGTVYRGMLRGTEVAVKRVVGQDFASSGIEAELRMLSRVRHPHIVALMGLSADLENPSLIYEYLSGGDLGENLNPRSGYPVLSCVERFRIAKEVASALVYMSQHQPPIVHRDLKPGNIMLDQHRTAKIADWGLAKNILQTLLNQTLAGTRGYIAPELANSDRELSLASDVYSFGVVLLQMLTGILLPGELHSLASNHGKDSLDLLDPTVILRYLDKSASPWPLGLAERAIKVALRCLSIERGFRPSLAEEVYPELTAVWREADAESTSSRSHKRSGNFEPIGGRSIGQGESFG